MTYLVVYNTDTGDIVTMTTVYDETAHFNGGTMITVPDGKILERMDVAVTPHQPVFNAEPVDPVGGQIDNIQLALIELDARLAELEEGN